MDLTMVPPTPLALCVVTDCHVNVLAGSGHTADHIELRATRDALVTVGELLYKLNNPATRIYGLPVVCPEQQPSAGTPPRAVEVRTVCRCGNRTAAQWITCEALLDT